MIAGARARLPDRAAREALTVYLDAASLLLAALVALLHPLGYVAVALLAWLLATLRARSGREVRGAAHPAPLMVAPVSSTPPKLVLCVIDAMAPAMLERAVAAGAAPVLQELIERGRYMPDCVAAFPSVTPVCAASIVTGVAQDAHRIPAMNWFHREEDRYVEYGSSLRAAQRFGIARQLTDTVYNMNRAHLCAETPTVFESLDDAECARRAPPTSCTAGATATSPSATPP